jgi:hypothetical protein
MQTLNVKFFIWLGIIIEVESIASHEINAPKKIEKETKPTQAFIINLHPSLKLDEPLRT